WGESAEGSGALWMEFDEEYRSRLSTGTDATVIPLDVEMLSCIDRRGGVAAARAVLWLRKEGRESVGFEEFLDHCGSLNQRQKESDLNDLMGNCWQVLVAHGYLRHTPEIDTDS